jgi:hypothetical protein
MIRKIFLILGICSFLAAAGLIAARGKENPFSRERKWWLSNKELHGVVYFTRFSPAGEKLFFSVRNEFGINSTRDAYLYTINERAIKKLNINNFDGYVSWSPDSRFLTFNQPQDYNRYIYTGIIYDTALDTVSEQFKIPFGGWDQPCSPDGKWQLFQTEFASYRKEFGKPVWVELPIEPHKSVPFWNYNGTMLIWFSPDQKNIYRYHVNEQIFDEPIHVIDFEMPVLMNCSPYANEVLLLTSRKSNERVLGRVVVRKLDLDSGQFTYSYDSGLDPEKSSLGHPVFISPQEILYFYTYHYAIKGKEPNQSREMKLDMKTDQTETLLKGDYRIFDYCAQRDSFSLSSKADDFKVLYLFDAKTRSFERIFPPDGQ